jgi:hypothetical protein
MNADWEPGTPSSPPPPTVSPTPTVTSTPTVALAGPKPTVKHGRVNVGINCGADAACNGTITIEDQPLVGATSAAKRNKPKIVYAKGSFSLTAGQNKTIAALLTTRGRTAAEKKQKLTVYIDITLGGGSSAHKLDKKVTLMF